MTREQFARHVDRYIDDGHTVTEAIELTATEVSGHETATGKQAT